MEGKGSHILQFPIHHRLLLFYFLDLRFQSFNLRLHARLANELDIYSGL